MVTTKTLAAKRSEIRPALWILLFCLVGFGLRLQKLSFQPLWGDEGWSFYFAMQSLPRLLALTAIDIHPPLYYILLKGWLWIVDPGPEAARLLSVFFGTALIPVVSLLGWRLFERRVGVAAAGIVALMPLAVYYAQEVRMYGLVTLLGAMSVYFFCRVETAPAARRRKWWLAYVITTTVALYTMYYAIFIPLFQGLYLLLTRFRGKPKVENRTMLTAMVPLIVVGLLYLPWVAYAGPRLASYVQNKRAVEGYVPLNLIRFFGDHFVAFSLGHLPPHLQRYVWAALPFVILASLGFVAILYLNRHTYSYLYLYLFLPLLAGYLVNQFYPFAPRYYERTLLLAAPAYWLFIAVGLIWLWDWQYLLVGTVVLPMLVIVSVSLNSFYTLSRYPHEDYRPLLRDIAARAMPQDTLLASYQWQLGFYRAYLPEPHPRLVTVPGWGQAWAGREGRVRLIADLTTVFDQSPRLWFPAHQALGHQWEDEAEAAIAALGYPALLQWYSPQTKLILAGNAPANFNEIPVANFENLLALKQGHVGNGSYEAGRGIVPVELVWQKQKNLGTEHRVSLRLVDAGGRTWATRDSQPQAGQAFFTDLKIGNSLADRHGLLIPAGTPPGSYRLLLSVRRVSDAHPLDLLDPQGQPQGAELPLNEIQVSVPRPPVGTAALPVQVATNATFGRSVRLVGYSLGHGPFKTGEALPLNLFWESLRDQPGSLTVFVELRDSAGQQTVWYERPPRWPSPEWETGDSLRDPHDVPLPPTLPPGKYDLAVGLLNSEQSRLEVDGQDHVTLTPITTVDRPHNFESPSPQIPLTVNFSDRASLVGLDLPHMQINAGEMLPLTLHWQAIQTFDKNWTVFVHLVDDEGKIVSQQDQVPGAGQYPTTGWVPGEYLLDGYNLLIPPDTPPGRNAYWLEIGLYDANDFSRLPVTEAGEFLNNHILLDSWPISVQ